MGLVPNINNRLLVDTFDVRKWAAAAFFTFTKIPIIRTTIVQVHASVVAVAGQLGGVDRPVREHPLHHAPGVPVLAAQTRAGAQVRRGADPGEQHGQGQEERQAQVQDGRRHLRDQSPDETGRVGKNFCRESADLGRMLSAARSKASSSDFVSSRESEYEHREERKALSSDRGGLFIS